MVCALVMVEVRICFSGSIVKKWNCETIQSYLAASVSHHLWGTERMDFPWHLKHMVKNVHSWFPKQCCLWGCWPGWGLGPAGFGQSPYCCIYICSLDLNQKFDVIIAPDTPTVCHNSYKSGLVLNQKFDIIIAPDALSVCHSSYKSSTAGVFFYWCQMMWNGMRASLIPTS